MDEKIVKDSQGLAKDLANDTISRQAAIDALGERPMVWVESDYELGARNQYDADVLAPETVPSAQPETTERTTETAQNVSDRDLISRKAAIDAIKKCRNESDMPDMWYDGMSCALRCIYQLPSAQPEQRYTEEELRVFAHGISLSLLSKRSAQHWQYDEDTATEIKFLERLYEKVGADMKGGQE